MHMKGRYVIHHAGQPCGDEQWSLERAPEGELASGEQVTRAPHPFPSTLEWHARLTRAGRLTGVDVRWHVGGRFVTAAHAAEGSRWRAKIGMQGHVREQAGDYPARAHVVLGSHMFLTFALRALALSPGGEHEFPTLAIGPPWMAAEPGSLIVRCTEARTIETKFGLRAARRVEVHDPARSAAEAFAAWIDEHGVVLASHEGKADALPWMTLVEYAARPA